ncbi:MAG: AI-2E family transporter [Planctomycetota bacterium]|jgi:AI-2 transport protein TqsA
MDAPRRERRVQTVCLLILAGVALAVSFYWMREVLVPLVLAVFLAIALSPLIDVQMRRMRVPRVVAVLTTLLLGLVILGLVAALVTASVGQFAANAEGYQQRVEQLLIRAEEALPLRYLRIGLDEQPATGPPATQPSLRQLGRTAARWISGALVTTGAAVMGIASRGALVLVFLLFLLLGGSATKAPASGIWREVASRTKRYLYTKLLTSVTTGVLVGLTLNLLGVDLALAFGFMTFLLNFIPSVGSVIATLLPVPVVLLSPEIGPVAAVLAIAIPATIQFLIGNVIEPKIMGNLLDLHPVTILAALIFWGVLWGIPGMFLATPITAVMKILLERMELTAPLAHLLAGRLDFGEPQAAEGSSPPVRT